METKQGLKSTGRGKLRVLHVENGHSYGGIQRMLLCLAENRHLCPEMEPSFAFCFEERLVEELHKTGVPVHSLGQARTRKPWTLLLARRRLHTLLKAEKFDAVIIHASWSFAIFGGVVGDLDIPLILWMHNDTKVANQNLLETIAGRQKPDLVIANSHFTAASIPLLFGRVPRHVVIYCPVTPPAHREYSVQERALIRAPFDTPPESVLLVQAGRPEAWKGHAQLLQSLRELRELPDWTCWIIGGADSPEQEAFLAEIKALVTNWNLGERVKFLGQRKDVPELLAAADFFCQPNLSPEPFGIVFIEALYAGLPVVSVRHGGAAEIVTDDCGRLAAPNDPTSLTTALRALITDGELRARLSQAAPARGAELSDPARILPELHGHLLQLLPARQPLKTGAKEAASNLTPA